MAKNSVVSKSIVKLEQNASGEVGWTIENWELTHEIVVAAGASVMLKLVIRRWYYDFSCIRKRNLIKQ